VVLIALTVFTSFFMGDEISLNSGADKKKVSIDTPTNTENSNPVNCIFFANTTGYSQHGYKHYPAFLRQQQSAEQ
jgi:hypothetical protein